MKLPVTVLFLCLTLLISSARCQSIVAVSSGVSLDILNKAPFIMVPVALRWEPFKRSGFFVEAIKSFVFKRLTPVDAYTINSRLPAHVVLTEALALKHFSIGLGGTFAVYTGKKNDQLIIALSSGICSENFTVTFRKYDQINYEVLNPDVGKNFSGLYSSVATIYSFHKGRRDLFVMLRLQSPSTASRQDNYALSYNKTAPLQLTFGYNLFYGNSSIR